MTSKEREYVMNAKPIVTLICFAAGCLAATMFLTSYGTAQTDAPQHPDAGGIRARYARAYLHLAEVDLEIVLDMNRRISGTYPENTVQQLRNHVEIAEMKLQYELAGGEIRLHDIHLKELERAKNLAEMNLANAIAINKSLAGTIDELEIKRLRLAAEVAKLAIDKGRDPASVSTPYTHLQWQLNQMQSELLWLHVRSENPH